MNLTTTLMLAVGTIVAALLTTSEVAADPKPPNYDENKIPPYTLPDPLLMANGQPVTSARMWKTARRPEILKLFQTQVYGYSPGRLRGMKFEVTALDKNALGGKATRKEMTIRLTGDQNGPRINVLIYVPNDAQGRVPAFVGLNFSGNHTVCADPGIALAQPWKKRDKDVVREPADEKTRGSDATAWQVEKILSHGYALVTAYYGDIEPDLPEATKLGIRACYLKPGQTDFAPDDWGAIGAWAWGLSRMVDYLQTDRDIDARHIALMGHSRLGKTALWAGAQDERFALVISNNSGEGGAALARRFFGETTAVVNKNFPHWMCGNFKQYSDHEELMPVDQHELLALIAPRPLYVASAVEDQWADPHGEFLSAKHAEPVYQLFGKQGLGVDEMPGLHQPVGETIRYHIRAGKHAVTEYDWEQYLAFADMQFKPTRK